MDVDRSGDYKVGQAMRETRKMQVKILQGTAVLPTWGSVGAAGYDLCGASSYAIHSRVKDTMGTGLAMPLSPGTYAQIVPRLGLAIHNFIDVKMGVVDLD